MNTLKMLVLIAALGASASAGKAQFAVAIAADPMWPVEAARWAEQISQATAAVAQAKQMAHMLGNPGDAIKKVSKLGDLADTVRDLTDKSNTVDNVADALDEVAALGKKVDGVRDGISENIDVYGKSLKRDVKSLKGALQYEAAVKKTRTLIEANRRAQKRLSVQLGDAVALLNAAGNQSEIAAAQAEVQRITALIDAGDVAMRNLVEDVRMKKEEFEIGREIEASSLAQEIQEKSLAVAEEIEKQRSHFEDAVGKALADGEEAVVDTRSMFNRSWLPGGN
jgi:Mg2+ and Co2+ transporter CorA